MLAKLLKTSVLLLFTGAMSTNIFAAFNNSPSATGAAETGGTYRNLANEFDKDNIQKKLDDSYDDMVSGDTTIYYEFGNDKAYIYTPDSDDVRTEGQSWAMTIAVMMNDQARFDKLWRFAKENQRNPLNSGANELRGTFRWRIRINGSNVEVLDSAPAPDGELYYAFALLNADARWGSDGTFDYKVDGESVLDTLRTKLMDSANKHIVFSPYWMQVTDPSYHIPAFYDYFAFRASSNQAFWTSAATNSRLFLQNHFGKIVDKLPTYLAYHDGWPATSTAQLDCNGDGQLENNPTRLLFCGQPNPGDMYEYDAWRVAMNIGLDAHLMGAQQWHKNAVNGLINFFDDERNNGCTYSQRYQWGGRIGTDNCGTGQVSSNAAALLASTVGNVKATRFFDDFWGQNFPSGDYRYYNGSMYMLALLQTTGQFKFHGMANSNDGEASQTGVSLSIESKVNTDDPKCLDSWGLGGLQTYDCWGGANQGFVFDGIDGNGYGQIRSSAFNGTCISGGGAGSNLTTVNCNGAGDGSQFKKWDQGDGYFTLQRKGSGLCVEVLNANNASGLKLQNCDNANNQQFRER